ncbi:phosphatase PAP2 family protein [Streptomyces sp. R33]|uniref:Phosphatase PAP2 family protein n=1 Tax=Streptomyces sp. R33 TaxID=3238629 RepID=A0AB39YGQ1_9ACTN
MHAPLLHPQRPAQPGRASPGHLNDAYHASPWPAPMQELRPLSPALQRRQAMRSGANHNSRGMALARAARSSFPSGHAAAAVAFAAAAPSWPLAAAACAVPTLLVGLERIHAGAHHPSDVAAGTVIGLASAALVRAAPRLERV